MIKAFWCVFFGSQCRMNSAEPTLICSSLCSASSKETHNRQAIVHLTKNCMLISWVCIRLCTIAAVVYTVHSTESRSNISSDRPDSRHCQNLRRLQARNVSTKTYNTAFTPSLTHSILKSTGTTLMCADLQEFPRLSVNTSGGATKKWRGWLNKTTTGVYPVDFSRALRGQRRDASFVGGDHEAVRRKDVGINRRFDDVVNLPPCR